MRRTGEEEVQRGPLGSAELSPELKLLRLIAWDIGRVLVGGFLVVILSFSFYVENLFRRWHFGEFHWEELALIAFLFVLGFAFLVGGVAALVRRRLAWWVSLVVLVVAGLGFFASVEIGSRIFYGTQVDSPAAITMSVPAEPTRDDPFTRQIADIERELVIHGWDQRWDVSRLDRLLEELARQADSPLVQSAKKRAEELRLMAGGHNPELNTLEYYQLWLELLSRPDFPGTKYGAQYLAFEIDSFHANNPEIAALKPKFDALFAASQSGPGR
jgi:hypothetical protein